MKLLEIIGEPLTPTSEPASTYDRRIRSQGYRKLGGGVFATARKHATYPTVMKRGPMNDGWVYFVGNVLKSPEKDNPYFPRIHAIKSFKSTRGFPYYVAEVEQLKPLRSKFSDLDAGRIAMVIESATIVRSTKDTFIRKVKDTQKREPAKPSNKRSSDPYQFLLALAEDPQFFQAITFLYALKIKYAGLRWDIHSGNLMLRGNHLIINDPFAHWRRDIPTESAVVPN